MNNLQDQGRACYKRGDYKKAIELFDRAIGRSPSVQLLDNRAACYEKLNDYSTGLSDAKKAIQLNREDAVGYLRGGRLLVKMEKQSVALEIYTHGLKCIKHVGQGYEQLRKVHKELMDQLCPPKSVDPMTVLPRELAETVLDYLSFRQRMNACLVSKQWTQFIRSVPNLWQHLDLSSARRKVRTAFVSRAINVARARLRSATLSNLYDFDKTLNALLKHCPLEELILLDCGLQGQNLTTILAPAKCLRSLRIGQGTRLNAQELAPLLTALADRLETLECWLQGRVAPGGRHPPCPKLKSLRITYADHLQHFTFLEELSDRFPLLEKLSVHQDGRHSPSLSPIDLQSCHQLRHLELELGSQIPPGLRLPPGVICLKLGQMSPSAMPSCTLPNLEELDIEGATAIGQIENFIGLPTAHVESSEDDQELERPSDLRKLSISCSSSNSALVERLVTHPRLQNLSFLSLLRCTRIDDNDAVVIGSAKLEKLRSIDLTGADLTGVGVKHLVSSLKIDTLILNACRNISPDAVEWAREKGITVKYRMGGGAEGGRKVRY